MSGVVVNFNNVGRLVDEGDYRVTFKAASAKKTRDQKKDVVLFQVLISGDVDGNPTPMDGKSAWRSYVIDPAADADNSGTLYYMQSDMMAFGVDEDAITGDEELDIVAFANQNLKGCTALASIVHEPDRNNSAIVRATVKFRSEDDE